MTIEMAPRLFVHGRGPNSAGTHDRKGRPFTGLADALATLTHERHAHAARTRNPHHEWVWTAEFSFCSDPDGGFPRSHSLQLGSLSSKGHTTFENGFENRYVCAVDKFVWFTNHGPDNVGLVFDDIATLEADRSVHRAVHAGTRMTWVDLQTGELRQFAVRLTGLIDMQPVAEPTPVGNGGAR